MLLAPLHPAVHSYTPTFGMYRVFNSSEQRQQNFRRRRTHHDYPKDIQTFGHLDLGKQSKSLKLVNLYPVYGIRPIVRLKQKGYTYVPVRFLSFDQNENTTQLQLKICTFD